MLRVMAVEEKLHPYPWPELLKRPRRKLLVPELLFTTGITSLIAPSGEGKTTLCLSIGMTVDTGSEWAGERIEQRPVGWIIGEDQDGLRAMYEAWLRENPDQKGHPDSFFLEDPLDLSTDKDANKLIDLIAGKPPMLLIADALGDMIGGLDEDKSRDMYGVYGRIERIVRSNSGAFLMTHHTGWNTDREKGTVAIRNKSDIVPQIVKFDPANGVIQLKHNKRRGGAKLKGFAYGVKLVSVDGYPQPIPIVTGRTMTAEIDDVVKAGSAKQEDDKSVSLAEVAAFAVILERWKPGDIISRADFQRAIEDKLRRQHPDRFKGGIGKPTMTKVLDRLIGRSVLERIGEGTGARYRVVFSQGGYGRKEGVVLRLRGMVLRLVLVSVLAPIGGPELRN
jgi:hypothetical protein